MMPLWLLLLHFRFCGVYALAMILERLTQDHALVALPERLLVQFMHISIVRPHEGHLGANLTDSQCVFADFMHNVSKIKLRISSIGQLNASMFRRQYKTQTYMHSQINSYM